MNFLFVVEGKSTEKKLYKKWVTYVHPNIIYVESIIDLNQNNFTIISGGGFPDYYNVIKKAFEDINSLNNVDYVFICVDSEEKDYISKIHEIRNFINNECCKISSTKFIIVQHHCIETWLMGNKNIDISRTTNEELVIYRNYYNVNLLDPEGLTSFDGSLIAKFTLRYLKLMLKEYNLSYNKHNVSCVDNLDYFNKLVERFSIDNHLKSFGDFFSIDKDD